MPKTQKQARQAFKQQPGTQLDAAVALENVTYGYESGQPVLSGVNLVVAQGASLALVGRSGSGKTTLARLIAGSLTANSGAVTVMGKSVGSGLVPTDPCADGRPALLVCTQEAHQFLGTVADNLRVVKPEATAAQMQAALLAVGANWVTSLPKGLDTELGAEEQKLSRDQVQQLALARIVLADPHVVILDESTTQLELLDATVSVKAVLENRAVIIISHDTRIAALADEAVLLQENTIVARGSVAEIFAKA